MEVKLCEALRVDESIDGGDLPVGDREGHHREQSSAGGYDGSCGAVDKRWSYERIELGIRGCVRGYGVGTAKNERGLFAQDAAIYPEFDVGIENRDERVEVTIARSGEERIDNLSLSCQISVRFRGSLYAPPRAAGELLGGGFGAVENSGDVRKRHAEHVVQHEREPLGGSERVEHHEPRQPDSVGEDRLLLGVDG